MGWTCPVCKEDFGLNKMDQEEHTAKEHNGYAQDIKMDLTSMLDFLKALGLEPVFINPDSTGFSRIIRFECCGIPCYIEWFVNQCYLAIGSQYGSRIPFNHLTTISTLPTSKKSLAFKDEAGDPFEKSVFLTLEKLDWQKHQPIERG